MIYKLQLKNVPDPATNSRKKKWYAVSVAQGKSTLPMIVDSIRDKCTVTRPDVLAVLAAFVDDVYQRLQAGQIVELGELGNMQLTILNFGGTTTKAAWTPQLIKKAKIVYRPSVAMKRAADNASFQRWSGDNNDEATTNP